MKMHSMTALGAASLLTLTLTACGSDTSDDATDAGGATGDTAAADLDLVAEDTLTVCSDVPYPPFEFEDDASPFGYSGFDMDLIGAVAEGLELEVEVIPSSFETLQSGIALNSSQCDLVASAMTITEDRAENVEFTEGYYDSLQSLLVAEDSEIAGIEDLDGVSVGVQQGTTGQAYAEENAAGAELVAFPNDSAMWQAVQAGQVDALLQDLPVNLVHTEDAPYTIIEEYDTEEQYGFAARQDNTDLVEAVNEQLSALRDSGEYQEIYDSYFTED